MPRPPTPGSAARRAAAVVALGLLTLDAAPVTAYRPPRQVKVPKGSSTQARRTLGGAADRARKIRSFANGWMGTRYQWGGETRGGVDCSGYSREMFRQVFGIELPRTTRTQIKLGQDVPIEPGRLGVGFEPGDLFFYVDPAGIPNHVVVYIGNGQFTHSASGRGVVVEGFKALWGRRLVGRRVLLPAREGSGQVYAAIPAAPSFTPTAVPCPPSVRPRPDEVRRYRTEALHLAEIKNLPERELCEWKALGEALRRRGGPAGARSASVVDEYTSWIESIDSFKDEGF